MSEEYTAKDIARFLSAANHDLALGKYKAKDMIPDYCKAVLIGFQLQAELAKRRWMRTDDPPNITDWGQVVEALECCAKIPVFMTLAAIFLDEDSDIEWWRPIILPDGE